MDITTALVIAFAILAVFALGAIRVEAYKIEAQASLERAKRWNGEPRTCCCKGNDCNGP